MKIIPIPIFKVRKLYVYPFIYEYMYYSVIGDPYTYHTNIQNKDGIRHCSKQLYTHRSILHLTEEFVLAGLTRRNMAH